MPQNEETTEVTHPTGYPHHNESTEVTQTSDDPQHEETTETAEASHLSQTTEETQSFDKCSPNPCQNGGTCVNGDNTYTCQCTGNFTGHSCHLGKSKCNLFYMFASVYQNFPYLNLAPSAYFLLFKVSNSRLLIKCIMINRVAILGRIVIIYLT